ALPGAGFPGLGAPPFAKPGGAGPSGRAPVAPNPFAPTPSPLQQPPAARPSRPPQGAAAPAAGGAPRVDPFASASPAAVAAAKKVTLVIDDSAVKEDEIGRKSRTRSMVLVVVGLLVGLGVGFGVGNTADKRHQYKLAVQDGKDIYSKIQEVSKTVDQAKALVKQAVDASSGGPGKKATVDFGAIEQLVAMKRPFSANEFHRRLYRAFGDGVVDDLFDYYNNVNLAWDGFSALGAKTAGAARRDALTKSAAATDGLLNNEYGMVLGKNGDMFAGSLVFLTIPPEDPAAAEKKPEGKGKKGHKGEDEGRKVKVSSSQGGQEVERTLYSGQDGLSEGYEKYVFLLDKVRSKTILGESANVFAKYRGELMDINARMEKASETQGRLLKSLGNVAALSN
ncbi:MAG TPA: hypothetical protein VJR89_02385, partial [Polyangiales bacterium]|nr:hypothetical protein [Polyangiales bacterium]